jgi:hypothetical protein
MRDRTLHSFDPELFKDFIKILELYDPRKKPKKTDKWRT